MRRIASTLILTVLLTSSLTAISRVRSVEVVGTIYIRANGNVEPITANITSIDNVTYIFTDDNYNPIVVERANVVVDGNGFLLRGKGEGAGFSLQKPGITIRDTKIAGFEYGVESAQWNHRIVNNTITGTYAGIHLDWFSMFSSITNNTIHENYIGIETFPESFPDIVNNTIVDNGLGLCINGFCGGWGGKIIGNTVEENNDGIALSAVTCQLRKNVLLSNSFSAGGYGVEHYSHDIDESNTIDGKPIYYWREQTDRSVPLDAGYVALVNCRNITVESLTLTGNGEGVVLVNTTYSVVRNVNIIDNSDGIVMWSSSHNRIYANNITDCWTPFSGGNNWDNHIFHNNFVDNSEAPWMLGPCHDTWDGGYPWGGNYWSTYNGSDLLLGTHQNFNGSDGIGDTPYIFEDLVGEYNYTDRYPLTKPWTTSWQPIPPMLPGDISYDGKVDVCDVVLAVDAYGSKPGDNNWNPLADLAPLYERIDVYDLVTLASYYGNAI